MVSITVRTVRQCCALLITELLLIMQVGLKVYRVNLDHKLDDCKDTAWGEPALNNFIYKVYDNIHKLDCLFYALS